MKMQQNKKLKSLHLLKRILFVFAFLNFLDFSFAENENSKLANKKTALRCLETASNYIFEKNWEAAKSQACFGIAYDDSISDLWYLYAVSENALGKTKAAVLPLIEKAIKNVLGVNSFDTTQPILANKRQKQCVVSALESVNEALDGAKIGVTYDAINVMIDSAVDDLLTLTGKKATEEVVNNIFSRFCVGK